MQVVHPGAVPLYRLGGVELLLAGVGDMVGADRVDGSPGDAVPERVLVLLGPQRRLSHEESGVGSIEPLPSEMEIDRSRLDVDGQPAGLGLLGDA